MFRGSLFSVVLLSAFCLGADACTGSGGSTSVRNTGRYEDVVQNHLRDAWNGPDLKGGIAATVRIRVEKDGRISKFSLARSSGNAVLDKSVMAAAKRFKQIDAPPASLTKAKGYYEVSIRFELTE